jgi:hypothetical protein
MTTNLLRRRVAPLATVAALIAAGIPALPAPAEAGAHPQHRHRHAGPPPDRVAYVQREVAADTTTLPQRTGEI